MPNVVDHSRHFELMAVGVEHERRAAEEAKKKSVFWGGGSK